jgi:hypothetical protein
MKRTAFISLLVLAVLLTTAGTALASQSRTAYRAGLGSEVTPASDAHGNAVFVFADDGSLVTYKLVINGLDNTLMAHIHVAPTPGANGPIVLWLYPSAPPASLIPGAFNGLLGSGSASPAELTGAAGIASFEDLRMAIEEGRAYVNVHTTLFPGGEIRGTIH